MTRLVPLTSCWSVAPALSSLASVCQCSPSIRQCQNRRRREGIYQRRQSLILLFTPRHQESLVLFDTNRLYLNRFEIGATMELYPRTNFWRWLLKPKRDLTSSAVLARESLATASIFVCDG